MLKKTFILFIFLYSFFLFGLVNAKDFSGTYKGITCNRDGCIEGITGSGILGVITSKKPTQYASLIYIQHDLDTDTITLELPDNKKVKFTDIGLDGDTFTGVDQKEHHQITGFFSGNIIEVTFNRNFKDENSKTTAYYKATLTPHEISYREQIELLNDKENEIDSLEKEKNQLNSLADTLKIRIQENSQDIAALKIKNSKLTDDLKSTIQIKDKEIKNIKATKDKQIKDALNQLDIKIKEPTKVNPSFLPNNAKVNTEVNLRASPSVESKIITTLAINTIVNNLVVIPPDYDWSFVVTENGLVGYVKSVFIISLEAETTILTPPKGENKNKINISFPKWDQGQENKRITINAPGFISIEGNINLETGIIEALINDTVIDDIVDSTGYFEAYAIIQSGKNETSIVVIDNNNERHELNFVIIAP